jgi:hypothetical protein
VRDSYKNEIDRIYVLARGNNIHIAKYVVEEIEKLKIYTKKIDNEFNIRKPKIKSYIAILDRIPS